MGEGGGEEAARKAGGTIVGVITTDAEMGITDAVADAGMIAE